MLGFYLSLWGAAQSITPIHFKACLFSLLVALRNCTYKIETIIHYIFFHKKNTPPTNPMKNAGYPAKHIAHIRDLKTKN